MTEEEKRRADYEANVLRKALCEDMADSEEDE